MREQTLLEAIVGATAASVVETVGSVAGAVAGFGPVKDWLHGCKTRALAGRQTPGNHDLVRGIRTAHLCALDHVARRYSSLLVALPTHEIGPDDHAFANNLRSYIDQRLKPLNGNAIDHDVLTIDDVDHVLEQITHAATHENFAELSRKAREDCEARALNELTSDAGRKAPELFLRVFNGDFASGADAGWYEAFSLFVTEELKTNERFRSIFVATELVDVRRAVGAISEVIRQKLTEFPSLANFMAELRQQLDRIEQGVKQANTKLDQQTQLLEQIAAAMGLREGAPALDSKIASLETELHATRAELIALLADIVGQGINPDQIESALRSAKENLEKSRNELERLRGLANEVPEIEPDLLAARAALDNPQAIDLAEAERAIGAARARYRTAIMGRRDREAINMARLLEAEASLSLARSDFLKAASLLADAANELPASERVLAAELNFRQGDALQQQGDRFPGLNSLNDAVNAYRAALRVYTQQDMPAQWAATQNNLGAALRTLGERQGGADGLNSLNDAVKAHRAALTVRTEQDMPADWAMTQNNLGNALQTLGERQGGADGLNSLNDAVKAYRAALTVRTEQDMPAQWAMTLGNQGIAMRIIADLTSDLPLARQALDQIETAFEWFRQAKHPYADFYEGEAAKARALVAKLEGRR